MPNNIKYISVDELSKQLKILLKERGYADSTIHCIEVEIAHLQEYILHHGLYGYNPEIGSTFLGEFFSSGEYSEKSVTNYKALINRLNDLFYGNGYVEKHYRKTSETPIGFVEFLNLYLDNCTNDGNSDESIVRKEIACRKFLNKLSECGCSDSSEITPEKIQMALAMDVPISSFPFIRDMFYFLATTERLPIDYSPLIPRKQRRNALPTVYSRNELEKVIDSIDTTSIKGKRDRAIILLSIKLGLRAGDIVDLSEENISQVKNEINLIQGKTGNPLTLVLLPEVKDALQEYMDCVRDVNDTGKIFISLRAPFTPIHRSLVHALTTEYLKKAGVDYSGKKHGPHSFRSSMATAMVNNGVSYDATRKVLGHSSPESIKHYASFDIEGLRHCAIKVPEATGSFADILCGKERVR